MAETTGIEWTDATFNPWIGCTAVSAACDHCYAEALVKRYGGDFATRRRTSPANWKKPLAWNRKAEAAGKRMRVFCASLADVFDNQVPAEWRTDLFALIDAAPWLDWQLLTKRPQNIAKMLPPNWGDGWPNVWLGTTVENQEEADRRIPHLLDVPARRKFLSCEPLLGLVDLHRWLRDLCPNCHHPDCVPSLRADSAEVFSRCGRFVMETPGPALDWIIVGGESGRGARPVNPAWARNLRDQCAAHGVPFFFKQWGEWGPDGIDFISYDRTAKVGTIESLLSSAGQYAVAYRNRLTGEKIVGDQLCRVGKKRAGSLLDGVEHKAFPEPAAGGAHD